MNPDEWLISEDARAMLDFTFPMHCLESVPEYNRKLSLYYCNLARLVWHKLPAPHRVTIEAAERYIEGGRQFWPTVARIAELAHTMTGREGEQEDWVEWRQELQLCGCDLTGSYSWPKWREDVWHDYALLVYYPFHSHVPNPHAFKKPGAIHRADLVRDAFPHKEFPIQFDSRWRTDCVTSLAESWYESHNFASMSVLADVLEESGCSNEQILDHCRNPRAIHARGCWVVDLILNRK